MWALPPSYSDNEQVTANLQSGKMPIRDEFRVPSSGGRRVYRIDTVPIVFFVSFRVFSGSFFCHNS